jgi:deazaflavin-dependent oxidoreductase (nitroreductase family)
MPTGPQEAAWNAAMIADLRAHGGQVTTGPLAGSNLLILTSRGATSGLLRTAPVGYTMDDDRYVLVGSNSGGPADPAWVRNVQRNPLVTVEAGGDRFEARATVQEGLEWRRLLDAHIAAIPIFGRYEGMAGRALPVVTLERLDPR